MLSIPRQSRANILLQQQRLLEGHIEGTILGSGASQSNSFKAPSADSRKSRLFGGLVQCCQLCKFFCKIAWKKLKIIYAVCRLKLSIAGLHLHPHPQPQPHPHPYIHIHHTTIPSKEYKVVSSRCSMRLHAKVYFVALSTYAGAADRKGAGKNGREARTKIWLPSLNTLSLPGWC